MGRAEEAAHRAEFAADRKRAEAQAAQRLIDGFVADAEAAGVAPEPLRASLLSGSEVKTDRTGWYLRKNRSVAIGTDGGYYLLTVPGGWRERLRGVHLTPSPPPLIVGEGGRDGETGPLSDFLRWRLEAG